MSRRTKTANEFLPRSAAAHKAAGGPVRKFCAADACRYHAAASLMTQLDRQAWANSANKAFRSGKTVSEAINEGNSALNNILDYEADCYFADFGKTYIPTTKEQAELFNGLHIFTNSIGAAFMRRFQDEDYYSAELDFDRHPQLLAAAELQRRAAGRSH